MPELMEPVERWERETRSQQARPEEWILSPVVKPYCDSEYFHRILEEMWEWPICGEEVHAREAEKRLEERFREQADKWQRETQHLSSPGQRMMHPSYQAIMGMANDNRDEVIDLLLRDMQQNRREWFWALSYLTHENPIDRKNAGKLDKMIEAWVRWGQQRRGR